MTVAWDSTGTDRARQIAAEVEKPTLHSWIRQLARAGKSIGVIADLLGVTEEEIDLALYPTQIPAADTIRVRGAMGPTFLEPIGEAEDLHEWAVRQTKRWEDYIARTAHGKASVR